MDEYEFEQWLRSPPGGNCIEVKFFKYKHIYAAVKPLLYHMTMIIGEIGNTQNIINSYCYYTVLEAVIALKSWNGDGDPELWFRNPSTGRRRPYSQKDQEYVAW